MDSYAAIAAHFGVAKSAVAKWKRNGCRALAAAPYDVDAIAAWRASTVGPPRNIGSDAARIASFCAVGVRDLKGSKRARPRDPVAEPEPAHAPPKAEPDEPERIPDALPFDDYRDAKLESERARARKLRLETEALEGKYLDRERVQAEITRAVAGFVAHFRSLPRRIADVLDTAGHIAINSRSAVEQEIRRQNDQSLSQLAAQLDAIIDTD